MSVSTQDFADLASRAFDATLDPERWNDFCEAAHRRIGGTGFLIFEYDLQNKLAPIVWGSDFMRQTTSAFMEEIGSEAEADDPAIYEQLIRKTPWHYVSEAELQGVLHERDLPPNGFRERLHAACGAKSRNGAKLNESGPWLDAAAIYMPDFFDDIPAPTLATATALLPLIAKAMETGRAIAALTGTYRLLLDLFDRLDFGAAFTDAEGRIVLANAAFRDMAAERDGLSAPQGRVAGLDRESTANLRRALASAFDAGSGAAGTVTTLSRRSGGLPLVLRAARIRDDEVRRGAPLALLLVLDPEGKTRIGAEGLAAFGLLSEAELDVIDLLVKGLGTDQIAERRGTTPETARGQIKDAAAKLACSSRLDLLRLALVTRAPLAGPDHPPDGG